APRTHARRLHVRGSGRWSSRFEYRIGSHNGWDTVGAANSSASFCAGSVLNTQTATSRVLTGGAMHESHSTTSSDRGGDLGISARVGRLADGRARHGRSASPVV